MLKNRLFIRTSFLIISLLLPGIHESHAADFGDKPFNSGRYIAVSGWGTKTCGDFTSGDEVSKAGMTDWLSGFITGVNATQPDGERMVGAKVSFDTLEAMLAQQCRDRPLEIIISAAMKVYGVLQKAQPNH